MVWLAIALGGALGAMARYAVTSLLFSKGFPWGTLTANLLGSALIGLCYVIIVEKQAVTLLASGSVSEWRAFLMTGFLGALTTYSTFALESFLLWQDGQYSYAVSYALASFIGSLLAVSASIFLATKLIH